MDSIMARAYVTSRFYPPLPAAYGDLAIEAIEGYHEDPEHVMVLPEDLNPTPRQSWLDTYTDERMVLARDLIDVLKLWHVVAEPDMEYWF